MDSILQDLGIALGLGTLAGLNLYLTVLVTGIAIRLDFLELATRHAHLEILGHPAVLTVAGVLFVLEFFADKIPWVDSLWDTVHTAVRPAGAVVIALPALGQLDPAIQVVGALLAGVAAITTHGAKASTRLVVNASPEPASNIAVSLVEDVVVLGGIGLMIANPVAALVVFALVIVALWIAAPKLFRILKANAYLMWSKLRLPGLSPDRSSDPDLPRTLNADDDILIAAQFAPEKYSIAWAVPAITGKVRNLGKLRANLFGRLIATQEHPQKIVFVGRRWFRRFAAVIDCDGCEVAHESRFLSENVALYHRDDKRQATFRLTRGQDTIAERLATELSQRARHTATSSVTPDDPQDDKVRPFPNANQPEAAPSEPNRSPAREVARR